MMNDSTVKAWEEKVSIPTYGIGKPDKNPMFFEKRVYQGSSGVVYPNAVIEKIFDEKVDKEYHALFLENKYIKVMILPELGGRIQMAYDKIKERHFVYYNQVIKPALVGLTGPWISGGIEFNWPQHHRPSTFEPIDFRIAENADGSKTIWVNEIEKMFHTKGMAGFTLYPDKAYIEIKAKLYNKSDLPQTFLWWANPAVKVNDDYQSVFPPDVNAVFDHGKRDVSTFPIATGTYYKVDYSPGTDISRYKNIPVPTSYMAINSEYDFVGGYEHDSKGGLLHVANHHISPGKKQWTWGHSDFGKAWDRNLTDEDGPYIELMTGVFTDNQPDFSWLMPNEQKAFTQFFLPYRELGVINNASKDILLSVAEVEGGIQLKVFATSLLPDSRIDILYADKKLLDITLDLSPEDIYEARIDINGTYDEELLRIKVCSAQDELIRYEPVKNKKFDIPQPASPAPLPADVENNEQLFLIAQHLEQYRHATYDPVSYYEEGLRRDPKDIRCNNGLGLWYLRRGDFTKAEGFLRKAIDTSVSRNPNPYDSEPYYNLGLCLKYLGRTNEAFPLFYKATWSNAWKDNGYFALAQIDMLNGRLTSAVEHSSIAIDNNANNNRAYVLKASALRRSGNYEEAITTAKSALSRDSFNLGAIFELSKSYTCLLQHEEAKICLEKLVKLSRGESHNYLEYALDYALSGLYSEAIDVISLALNNKTISPMTYYALAWFERMNGQTKTSEQWLNKAAKADPYLCFPNRLAEIIILESALRENPTDAMPAYYLGNLFYDKRQYDKAIAYWESSAKINDTFPTVLRNLGIAYFNKRNDAIKALDCYEKAFALDPKDARILMEFDQLKKRMNRSPVDRLVFLDQHSETVNERDDLYLELVTLYNLTGDHETALEMIMRRNFHPWEGGEGKVTEQYVNSLISLAVHHRANGQFKQAINLLERAQVYPINLGEGKLYGAQENEIFYWLGCAYEALNDRDNATSYFVKASTGLKDLKAAVFYNDQKPDKMFYQGLALQKLGKQDDAEAIFHKLISYGQNHDGDKIKVDYFAVSLPDLLVFDDDLNLRNHLHCIYLQALGYIGIRNYPLAEELLDKAIKIDAAHPGSRFHKLLIELNTNSSKIA